MDAFVDDKYIGEITLPYNLSDTSTLNNRPELYRWVNITYALDKRWSRYSSIRHVKLYTKNYYTSGNGLLLDLIKALPENEVKHLDNPNRQAITIVWTGPIPVNGKVLSTREDNWDEGVVYLKR